MFSHIVYISLKWYWIHCTYTAYIWKSIFDLELRGPGTGFIRSSHLMLSRFTELGGDPENSSDSTHTFLAVETCSSISVQPAVTPCSRQNHSWLRNTATARCIPVNGKMWRLNLLSRFWARLRVWREGTVLRADTSCCRASSLSLHFSRRRQSLHHSSKGGRGETMRNSRPSDRPQPLQQGRAETFRGAAAQTSKRAHGKRLICRHNLKLQFAVEGDFLSLHVGALFTAEAEAEGQSSRPTGRWFNPSLPHLNALGQNANRVKKVPIDTNVCS